jgi:hypothetical protein
MNPIVLLEKMCSEKDEEIKRQGYTITTLTNMSRSNEQEMELQRKVIEKEKQELDQKRLKQEKRVTTATAEEGSNYRVSLTGL